MTARLATHPTHFIQQELDSRAKLARPAILSEPVIRVLRASERIPSPWKNGGGITFEVASFPQRSTLDTFGWRISMAQVQQGGPFSVFPDVDRQLAVLEGRLSLAVAGRDVVELSQDSPVIRFPGDVPTTAHPLSPLVTDLNVMTRRGQFTARMERKSESAEALLTMSDADITAVIALGTVDITLAESRWQLHHGDALLMSEAQRGRLGLSEPTKGGSFSYFLIEISGEP